MGSFLSWLGPALICSMKFLSLQSLLFYLFIMKYCFHVWASARGCYFHMLDKMQKWVFRIVSPLVTAFLKPLTHCWNMASLSSLFYRYYFGKCSSELAELIPISECGGIYNRFDDFAITIVRWYKDMYVSSFFPCTARLWNSLSGEYLPLTSDLNDIKSRVIRYLLSLGSC